MQINKQDKILLDSLEFKRKCGELDPTDLLVLSDLYIDAGKLPMAALCRYSITNPRRPYERDGGGWYWSTGGWDSGDVLPCEIFNCLFPHPQNPNPAGIIKDCGPFIICIYLTRKAADKALGRALIISGTINL